MSTLLIASTNPGKLLEIQEILLDFPYPVQLLLPKDLGLTLDVVENGHTYAENASLKAIAYAEASNLPVLADDSGLEVLALNGAPGLYSARYAPQPGATDADRRHYLLQNLRGQPRPWPARFVCAVAICQPGGELYLSRGECSGEIIPTEMGSNGFGYDPIFWIPERNQTMAQLASQEKNRISHRANAVRSAFSILEKLFAAG